MLSDFVVDLLPGGRLSVKFPFSEQGKRLIRDVPGRKWHPEYYQWSIPALSFRELQKLAAEQGAHVLVSQTVQESLDLGGERRQEIERAKEQEEPLDLPTATVPYPFQYSGIRFANHALRSFKGALIADDLGLGKTFEALSVIVKNESLQAVLVLCPATLKRTWADEIDRHYPQLTYTIIKGTRGERQQAWASSARIKIANYELLPRDAWPRMHDWDLVIADEATMIKSYRAQRTKTAKKLSRRYTLALSGIPLENRLEELHSIMDFVAPGCLGEGWLFVQEHVVKDYWGNTTGYRGVEQVKQRIRPYVIRRRKSEVLKELPPKVYTDCTVELSGDEWALYNLVRVGILDRVEEAHERNEKLNVANLLVEMLRLKQITNDARLVDVTDIASSKLETLRDILEQALGAEHQVVVFTQFAEFAKILANEFQAAVIHGQVPVEERAEIIQRFQAGGDGKVLVSTEAGAYGVTLTAADIVVHMDQPWNPAKLRQREDRLHRIGQEASVQVVNLIAARTIDEKVRAILHRKRELIRLVLDEEIEEEIPAVTKGDLLAMLGVGDDS